MNQEAQDKLVKARTQLILYEPFFGTLALRMAIVETADIPTMGVDGKRLFYNPHFVNSLSPDMVKGVICHEVMHLVLMHHLRIREGWHMPTFNMACDYVVNPIVRAAGLQLPQSALFDDRFNEMIAEQVYRILIKENPPKKISIGVLKRKGNDKDGEGGGISIQNSENWDPGQCGGIISPDSPSGKDKPTPAEIKEMEGQIEIEVTQATNFAKMMGHDNGYLDRLVKDLLEPVVAWEDLLRDFVERSARNDYTWARPNSRYTQMGVYLPSLLSMEVGTGVIAVDTSGSVSHSELLQFASEISSILSIFPGIEIDVIYCAHQMDPEIEHFTGHDFPIELHPHVSGGTSFRPPFEYLEEQGERPTFLIYFTDLACSDYPDFTPDYPVLWLSTSGDNNYYGKPPWGDVINMDNKYD